MLTEAQKRAKQKYAEKMKRMTIDFSPTEAQVWEHIQQQKNKQGYIKSLVRKDMEKSE